ncbi:hypothetical protein SDC9_175817 [bioreactor metagenome]|uniref:Uncharacterized protein n=1 Tax=bioreactor metagenome TaxID=1076179 RepID=A0A645GQB3_9ZZZZ
MPGDHLGIPFGGIQAGADGSCSHVDLIQERPGDPHPFDILSHTLGPSDEFLPQRHGNGVLKLGSPHLQNIAKLPALFL